jgi:predicted PurR-regulated permease PerM
MEEQKIRKILAIGFISIITLILIYLLWPYANAFVGSLIIFFILRPLYNVFVKKLKWNKSLSAILTIFISILIILLPLMFLISFSISESQDLFKNGAVLSEGLQAFISEYNLQVYVSELGGFIEKLLLDTIQNLPHIMISLTIMYFILFYLLINADIIDDKIMEFIPFGKKNSQKLLDEFKNIINSGVISTGIIAIIQGFLIWLGFVFFGLKGAILWGFIGALVSFLPVIGTAIIWLPISLFSLVQGNYYVGIGFLIWGLFLSNIDNLIKPFLQKKIGKIHPIISLVGIFIGIPIFGIFGVVAGPLFLSYFLLTLRMFQEEYL